MKWDWVKENVLALMFAGVISATLIFAINSLGFLDMNVLGTKVSEQPSPEVDVIFKLQGWDALIVANKKFEDVKSVGITLLFNPEVGVNFSGQSITTSLKDAKIKIAAKQQWLVSLFVELPGVDIKPNDVLISFPFSGDMKDISIGDITITDSLGTGRALTYF